MSNPKKPTDPIPGQPVLIPQKPPGRCGGAFGVNAPPSTGAPPAKPKQKP